MSVGNNSSTIAKKPSFKEFVARPRTVVYSLIAVLFVVWAVHLDISIRRSEAEKIAFENSPEGRAKAKADDLQIEEEVQTEVAETLVRSHLRDPDSGQFSGLRFVNRGGNKGVCGYVNARNGFGGMAGNEAFAVIDMTVIMAKTAGKRELRKLDQLCY